MCRFSDLEFCPPTNRTNNSTNAQKINQGGKQRKANNSPLVVQPFTRYAAGKRSMGMSEERLMSSIAGISQCVSLVEGLP